MKRPRSLGIHDGTFHADEVTACGLLILFDLIDLDKIIRSRDPTSLGSCEFVCDVGGVYDSGRKLFDHHQVTYEGELSSAGMVLLYLKEKCIISENEYQFFNGILVLGVDAHDNGRCEPCLGQCTFSHVIANYNPPSYETPDEELEEAFFEALQFVVSYLRRLHCRYQYECSCQEVVKEIMERDKICLFFDRGVSWLESFFALGGEKHPALFVIMPAKGQWKLRGIPPDYEHRMQVRMPLPEAWAGLLEEELKEASGIDGAVFCHKGRFTSVWETREDAIKALKIVLDMNGVPYENAF